MRKCLAVFGLCSFAASAQPLTVVMVGDVLLHQPQHVQALRDPEGHVGLWSSLVPLVEQADIAYANLEGPIAPGTVGLGREVQDPGAVFDKRVYTSYPMFNYHAFLADDLKRSGFDVVSTANNHALDRGSRGIELTQENLQRVGLAWTGTRSITHPSWAARVRVRNWVVSFVACTEHTNGIADSKKQVLPCTQEALDVVGHEKADPAVDVVIVTPHWGDEYQRQPNARQQRFAQQLADAGATAIVGSHPHVTQPAVALRAIDGRAVPVVYSLGNFVSNQFHRQATQEETLAVLVFDKTAHGTTVSVETIPLRMTKGGKYEVKVNAGETKSVVF